MGQDDLRTVLSKLPAEALNRDLLVGNSTNDDAAVLRIDGQRAIAQTVDFFTPIVDDPRLFGAIAAANSVSDIYAMGAEPILALAIAAFPTDKLPLEILEEILAGGADKAREAGFPIAGGHTIIDDVPKYGLAVTGIVDVDKIVRNSTARPGDLLYLTKPLGNGILISAYRASTTARGLGRLMHRHPPDLEEAVHWMTMLNREAARAMTEVGVTAATDVTGYGLVGHLLEMCLGAGVGAEISAGAAPVLKNARELLKKGFVPAGTMRNVDGFRRSVRNQASEDEYRLLCDAQTSGGLLLTVAPERESALVERFRQGGLFCARIGRITGDPGTVTILP